MKKIITSRTFLFVLLLLLSAFQKKQDRPITIFMIGDSTMANKVPERSPETGWGQVFGQFFTDKVKVDNHAFNGRSSKSFIDEGRWDKVNQQLKPGDYVFIQFGHNDQNASRPERYTNPYSSYRANLERYVTETRLKGAVPIILSSIVRRKFNEKGTLEDTHGAYPFVARICAKEMGAGFIDLQLLTEKLITLLGPIDSEKLFLILQPGESENYPHGITDNTHLSVLGAERVASLVADELRHQNNPLSEYLTTGNDNHLKNR
ncbi:MAG: rhamnogalacturonan acetylesterase [Prolixibacteraceae bacterium]